MSVSRKPVAAKKPANGAPAMLRITPALKARVRAFKGVPVAVWGDLVLDRFQHGTIHRLSREAPVPIIEKDSTQEIPGGGGNALMNLVALGARASVYSLTGNDEAGATLLRIFKTAGVSVRHLAVVKGHETASKTRILAAALNAPRQQLARVDAGRPYRGPLAAHLGAQLRRDAKTFRAIVISDYGYGAVSPAVFSAAPWPCFTAIDSRYDFLRFRGATTATPNETELYEALDIHLREGERGEARIDDAAKNFRTACTLEALLVTRGGRGSSLFMADGRHDVGVYGGEVADVTGAGDTVIATVTLARATGATWPVAQQLAGIAAGLKVAKRGTATVSAEELQAAI